MSPHTRKPCLRSIHRAGRGSGEGFVVHSHSSLAVCRGSCVGMGSAPQGLLQFLRPSAKASTPVPSPPRGEGLRGEVCSSLPQLARRLPRLLCGHGLGSAGIARISSTERKGFDPGSPPRRAGRGSGERFVVHLAYRIFPIRPLRNIFPSRPAPNFPIGPNRHTLPSRPLPGRGPSGVRSGTPAGPLPGPGPAHPWSAHETPPDQRRSERY